MDDVQGDGNCGYYVTAEQLGPFMEGNNLVPPENEVNYIRQRLLQTLRKNKEFYKTMMRTGPRKDAGVEAEYVAFERPETFNCVVHCFAWTGSSFTYAPPTKPYNDGVKDRRLVLGFVQNCHFIGLKLRPGCPLPPLMSAAFWPRFENNFAMHWCANYATEMDLWKSLHVQPPSGQVITFSSDEDEDDKQEVSEDDENEVSEEDEKEVSEDDEKEVSEEDEIRLGSP
uniref:PKS-NRPS hybrid synthetase n=1 Tax=Papaver somniferum TaxID=3469 RepID=A0A5B7LJM8_PAPSO|nr:PKS-NRPS hybrid synthetase [Papaver somniferum]